MTRVNYLLAALCTAGAFVAGYFFHEYRVPMRAKAVYLKLNEPLLLQSEGAIKNFHMLPEGTALYQDRAFPEGHTRYIVYLNIKGEFAAEKLESHKPNLIDPIWGYPVQREDLAALIADTPVSKEDLVRILKARKMTREDLAQIVREWRD